MLAGDRWPHSPLENTPYARDRCRKRAALLRKIATAV